MIKTTIYFTLFILFTLLPHSNANSRNRVDSILNELDCVIRDKEIYHNIFEKNISQIKDKVSNTTDKDKIYELYEELFYQYLHFQADSALHYVNLRAEMLKDSTDRQRNSLITINRAEVFGIMGMYTETPLELSKISPRELEPAVRGYFYRTYRAYYGWVADYTSVERVREKYLELANTYRDSIILYEPIAINRSMNEMERLISQNRLDEAIRELNILSKTNKDQKQQAYIHYNLSLSYLKKNKIDNAIFCLAQTAILDIMMGTREYASLQHLAYILYQQGEVERAYDYLNCSMADAVASNAKLRFMEVTKYFPIIDRAYHDKDAMQRNVTLILLVCVSLFAIVLIIFLVRLFLSKKHLTLMRADLHTTNESLVKLNSRLVETGRIKEVYIARYLDRCVNYIDKLDLYRRSLKRLASSSKIDELTKALQSDQMLQRERKEFLVEFDNSFLTLFPNFVHDFNMLLNESDRIKLKSEGQLNTELRIFALIRLGINDSSQIAHFLGYSLATVYSYRSKMRNRAVVEKDTFEQKVMDL